MPMEPLTPIEIKMQPGKTYYYRLTTSFMDQMNHGKGKEKLWTRNVGVLFTEKTREHFHFQILCFRTEVKLEKAIPQYNLLREISYLFNDIRICVNEKGEAVKLKNLKKIQERWYTERRKLEAYHSGSSIELYFDFLSRLLQDESRMIGYLLSYEMYGMFFNGSRIGNLKNENDTKYPRKVKHPHWNKVFAEEWNEVKEREGDIKKCFHVKGKPWQTEETNTTLYEGSYLYSSGLLHEGYLDINYENQLKKYRIVWIG